MRRRKVFIIILFSALLILLAASVCINIYFAGLESSYLQDPSQIYVMESGILKNTLKFRAGQEITLKYDLEADSYAELAERYGIAETAGSGSEFERVLRLMHEYAPRLHHDSWYDNHIEMSALKLLEFSLDRRDNGINCRSKAQILNEMCLALGICSRKVWIMPNSPYDNDCHVVNEVWDSSLEKWVMLDITNDQYWVDENGVPLSILEIRTKGAMQEFCTPVSPGDDISEPERLRDKHMSEFLYIMKNMVYMEYCSAYSDGEAATIFILFPEALDTDYPYIISELSCLRPPYDTAGDR